ncbi:MAG TPA: hypothetical protein VF595_03440 [Tepidisphaeraceae bacterium]|jgi:hypothetical protein
MVVTSYSILFVVAATFLLFVGIAIAAKVNAERGRAGSPSVTTQVVNCPRAGCGCDNPVDARFCRRCGTLLMKDVAA